MITTETAADCTQAIALIDGITAPALLADKAYDTGGIVEAAASTGIPFVIPPKKNRKETGE